MTPKFAVYDDFLPTEVINSVLAEADFSPRVNPADGLTYQGISDVRSVDALWVIEHKILDWLGDQQCVINHMFLRLMTETMPPSNVHVDRVMGQFSLHVYMTKDALKPWGTQFWSNRIFGATCPTEGPFDPQTVNRPCDWDRKEYVEAKFNRALFHDSNLWHSADPADGFGTSKDDGRLVLTTFFTRSET